MIQGRRATRLPLAIILCAVGAVVDRPTLARGDALRACPWLSYCAPLALWSIDHSIQGRRATRLPLTFILRAVGAERVSSAVG
jgi:hypothetical protein